MKRCLRRLLIALAAVALTLGILYECATHVGRGWLCGEAFFEGRPASYWRSIIQADIKEPNLFDENREPRLWWHPITTFMGLDDNRKTSFALVRDRRADGILRELGRDQGERVADFGRELLKWQEQENGTVLENDWACGAMWRHWIRVQRMEAHNASRLGDE